MSFNSFGSIKVFLEKVADTSDNAELAQAAKDILNMIESGEAKFSIDHTYWFLWQDGDVSKGRGSSAEDAFSKMGYGGGAIHALDTYWKHHTGIDAIKRLSSVLHRLRPHYKEVLNAYAEEITNHLNSLEGDEQKSAVALLSDEIREAMELMVKKPIIEPFIKIRDEFRK